MKKDLERKIILPEGFSAEVAGKDFILKRNGKELSRTFDIGKVKISVENQTVKLSAKLASRRESKMIGTIWAHIRNMIQGLQSDFVYELEICNVHFPMNVKLDGDKVIIKSFLGERTERVARVMPNVKLEIKGSNILVSSPDKESAGQTAANLEKATRLQGRDRRIFQDGIYIVNKAGRKI